MGEVVERVAAIENVVHADAGGRISGMIFFIDEQFVDLCSELVRQSSPKLFIRSDEVSKYDGVPRWREHPDRLRQNRKCETVPVVCEGPRRDLLVFFERSADHAEDPLVADAQVGEY